MIRCSDAGRQQRRLTVVRVHGGRSGPLSERAGHRLRQLEAINQSGARDGHDVADKLVRHIVCCCDSRYHPVLAIFAAWLGPI